MGVEHYEPFGEEWKAEMMKMRKSDILDAFAHIAKERNELRGTLDAMGIRSN